MSKQTIRHSARGARPDRRLDHSGHRIALSAIEVRWSETQAAFVARTDEYPELTHADPWSSLSAMDGLVERIQRMNSG
ncbi:hypothetical protein [Nocardia inohanensis]|uniref:hypothetical protein n=1 Tax=Nocardia inohanensis TaxID=209246 RepID=UPI0008353930|nr:hypothetical protein [Nocardia inohanensis]